MVKKNGLSVWIFFDGKSFVAQDLDRPKLIGRGATRSEALVRLEETLTVSAGHGEAWAQQAARPRRPRQLSRASPIKLQLMGKFGKLSNRELAAQIGIIDNNSPAMLSAAMAGQGTRRVRCAIANALNVMPSVLWPNRPDSELDDEEYATMARNT